MCTCRTKASSFTCYFNRLIADLLTGPLELTRRQKVLVWDDEIEITDEQLHGKEPDGPDDEPVSASSPRA